MVVLGGWAVSYERGTPVPVVLVVFGDPGHERALEKRVRVEARSFLPCGTEAGSYLRLIHSCITQLKAQGPSRTCNESKEEEEGVGVAGVRGLRVDSGKQGVRMKLESFQGETVYRFPLFHAHTHIHTPTHLISHLRVLPQGDY